MTELDFNTDRADLVAYVADKVLLAEAGDEQAINYIEYLWDADPDLLDAARESVEEELAQ